MDIPRKSRGAAATRLIIRGDRSGPRRDVDGPWETSRGAVATWIFREETSRGAAAAETRIFRGDAAARDGDILGLDWRAPQVARLTESAVLEPTPRRLALLGRVHSCERQWLLSMERYRDALAMDSSFEMAKKGLDQVRIKHEPLPLVTGLT